VSKKRDMYINYEKYNKKQRRRRRRGSMLKTVMLVIMLLGIGSAVYFWVFNFLINRKKDIVAVNSNHRAVINISDGNKIRKQSGHQDVKQIETSHINDTGKQTGKSLYEHKADKNNKDLVGNETKETQDTKKDIKEKVPSPIPVQVKGIYVTALSAVSKKMDKLVEAVQRTEINAMVIDIKNDEGKITYKMDSELVQQYGSDTNVISDIKTLISKLKNKNIYLIARIVAFKDPYLAKKKKMLAIKKADGTLYYDNMNGCWVNPYKKDVWEYLIEVASQAVKIGFDEIQFDYMRFPTDGAVSKLNYGKAAKSKTKEQIIAEFAKYASDKLKPLGVFVSADVYGAIIMSSVDAAVVGQAYAELSKYLDYICPMIYPSHFGEGNFGIKYPDLEPGNIIRKVLEASNTRLSSIPKGEHKATVRPWLQDFTAKWVKPHITYGGKEVRAQIDGVYAAGYAEWILWNSSCNYSMDGLLDK
jgi:hypothetical protein